MARSAMRTAVWSLPVVVGLMVFARVAPTEPSREGQGTRRFEPVTWVRTGGIAPSLDSGPLSPLSISADGGSLILYDYGDQRLKAYDRTGSPVWTVGGGGEGPGEFQNPTDVEIDGHGGVWVLDPGGGRIEVFHADGRLDRTIALGSEAERIAPLNGGGFLLDSSRPGALLRVYDASGTETDQVPVPSVFADVPARARELWLVVDPAGECGIVLFLYSDRVVESCGPRSWAPSVFRGIEREEFPRLLTFHAFGGIVERLDPDAHKAALDGTVVGDSLFVLYAGETEKGGRILDEYVLPTGRYVRSYLLPFKAHAFAWTGRDFAFLSLEPVPEVRILRRAPRAPSD